MELFEYEVRPGFYHGAQRQYGPGDRVVLTKTQAAAFDDKLKLVGPAPVPDPAPVEVEAEEVEVEAEEVEAKPAAVKRGAK